MIEVREDVLKAVDDTGSGCKLSVRLGAAPYITKSTASSGTFRNMRLRSPHCVDQESVNSTCEAAFTNGTTRRKQSSQTSSAPLHIFRFTTL